jgi:hypothetical protein
MATPSKRSAAVKREVGASAASPGHDVPESGEREQVEHRRRGMAQPDLSAQLAGGELESGEGVQDAGVGLDLGADLTRDLGDLAGPHHGLQPGAQRVHGTLAEQTVDAQQHADRRGAPWPPLAL